LSSMSTKYWSVEGNVNSLRGGNQQKIVLANWLAADCKCIIVDEPTRGVDDGAKSEIYNFINELDDDGVAVIVIAYDMVIIRGLCDRSLVMKDGKVVGE